MEAEVISEKNSIFDVVCNLICEPKTSLQAQSPLTLAFIGDAVYSMVIRTMAVNMGNTANAKLHERTTRYVSARAQAWMYDFWIQKELLTTEEADILRRGYNAKTHSQAKNASSVEYHKATGVEALSGYLYQKDEVARIVELISIGIREYEKR